MDFDEFVILMEKIRSHQKESDIKNIFDRLDKDGSGSLESGELKLMMQQLGY